MKKILAVAIAASLSTAAMAALPFKPGDNGVSAAVPNDGWTVSAVGSLNATCGIDTNTGVFQGGTNTNTETTASLYTKGNAQLAYMPGGKVGDVTNAGYATVTAEAEITTNGIAGRGTQTTYVTIEGVDKEENGLGLTAAQTTSFTGATEEITVTDIAVYDDAGFSTTGSMTVSITVTCANVANSNGAN